MTIHRAGPVLIDTKMTIHRAGPVYSLVLINNGSIEKAGLRECSKPPMALVPQSRTQSRNVQNLPRFV